MRSDDHWFMRFGNEHINYSECEYFLVLYEKHSKKKIWKEILPLHGPVILFSVKCWYVCIHNWRHDSRYIKGLVLFEDHFSLCRRTRTFISLHNQSKIPWHTKMRVSAVTIAVAICMLDALMLVCGKDDDNNIGGLGVLTGTSSGRISSVSLPFKLFKIVPDFIRVAPKELLQVSHTRMFAEWRMYITIPFRWIPGYMARCGSAARQYASGFTCEHKTEILVELRS